MILSLCKCSISSTRLQSIAKPSSLAQLKRKSCAIYEGNFISFRSKNVEFNSAVIFERCFNIIWRVLSVGLLLPRSVNPKKLCPAIRAEKYLSLLTKLKILVLQSMSVFSLPCSSLFKTFSFPKNPLDMKSKLWIRLILKIQILHAHQQIPVLRHTDLQIFPNSYLFITIVRECAKVALFGIPPCPHTTV